MSMEIKLQLPIPPSLNRKYINNRFVVSSEWRSFKRTVSEICQEQRVKPFTGEVGMEIVYYRPRKAGDIDNKLKAVLDSLQGWAYEDDKQVAELSILRSDSQKKNPRMEVKIYEL